MDGKENTMEMRINRLPAITWNRMEINDISVILPSFTGAELLNDTKLQEKWATHATFLPGDIATGAGEQADAVFADLPVYTVAAGENEALETLVTYGGTGNQGAILQVDAGENSQITLYTHVKTAEKESAALRVLLNLGKNAKVRLVELLEPGQSGALLHDLGGKLGENADIEVLHLYLGGGDIYSGCRVDLVGDGANFTYQAGYLGKNSQVLDVNLIANHFGKNTTCNLRADGTLKDQARKTFRGTIDFKRGCKGSVGAEQENVLLLGEDIVNKTIPLILCAEEDVQGDHGATIGELDEDTLFFFAARGIDPVTAENILTREKLYRLAEAMGREDVVELARNAIGEVL